MAAGPGLEIRAATPADHDGLFGLFAAVVEDGGTYPQIPPVTREAFEAAWLARTSSVQVAIANGGLAGSYFLRPNFSGRAAHIANAGYAVAAAQRGRGIGRALGEHSLAEARRCGFDALIFNLVFEHNPARRLWESLGFTEIGRIPRAIAGGDGVAEQDAVILWRSLVD